MWQTGHLDKLASKAGEPMRAVPMGASGPSLGMPLDRLLIAVVCSFPLWFPVAWISGLTLFAALFVMLASLFVRRAICVLEWVFAAGAFCLVLGLVVGQLAGFPSDRVMSSIYHILHWGILLAFIKLGIALMQAQDWRSLYSRLSSAALICLGLMIAYMGAMAFVAPSAAGAVRFPSLVVGPFASQINMLSGYAMIEVVKVNSVLSGHEWRLIGFGLWTSEGAYLAVVIGLLAMWASKARFGWAGVFAVEGAVLMALFLTGSRTTIAAYCLTMAVWALLFWRNWRVMLVTMLPLLVGLGVFFVAYGFDMALDAFHRANEFRQDSSGARFVSYLTAIDMTLATNPLTGLGYTPKIPEILSIPIGSHSSWTSILIRAGLLGVAVFAVIYGLLIKRLGQSALMLIGMVVRGEEQDFVLSISLIRAVLVTLMWWMTEDLDGPAAGAAFAGLVIGLFWAWSGQATRVRGLVDASQTGRHLQGLKWR